MTYEELLAKINYELRHAEFQDICGDGGHPPTHKALRAVVELHLYETHQIENKLYQFCNHCQTAWPCPTIQVIKKELA